MENKEVKEKDNTYTSTDPISDIVDIELMKSAKKSEPLINAFIKEARNARAGEGYKKPYNIDEILMATSTLILNLISTMYENEDNSDDGEDYDYNPRMEKVTTLLAVAAGVVICIIVIILAVNVVKGMGSEDGESNSPIQTDEISGESSSESVEYVKRPDVE